MFEVPYVLMAALGGKSAAFRVPCARNGRSSFWQWSAFALHRFIPRRVLVASCLALNRLAHATVLKAAQLSLASCFNATNTYRILRKTSIETRLNSIHLHHSWIQLQQGGYPLFPSIQQSRHEVSRIFASPQRQTCAVRPSRTDAGPRRTHVRYCTIHIPSRRLPGSSLSSTLVVNMPRR